MIKKIFMRRQLLCWLIFFYPVFAKSQPETSLSQPEQIAAHRQALILAFQTDNPSAVRTQLDSLRRLEDDNYLPLQWDERWLLYVWLKDYDVLLGEAARFTKVWEENNALKIAPPEDSLFKIADNRLYEGREQYFEQIRQSGLQPEEKTFAMLLLDFLLRLSTEEPAASEFDARLDAFLQEYPNSRFARFMRSRMYNTPPPGSWALSIDVLFLQGNWSGMLESHFRSSYGGDFALGYWQNRWNFYLRVPVGGQKLLRPVEANGYFWEKDESSTFFGVELEAGYDIISKSRLRVLPTVGGGYTSLRPPAGTEEDPNPDYFDFFKFQGGHLTAALQADVKFKSGQNNVATSYHGVRVRVGYRWLNLGRENPALRGNMFFFAVGYTIFGRQAQT